jgi:hypothetical protein
MLADDRPAYPMNFFIRLRFAGRFDRSALDTAASIALARHPLLTAIAYRSGRRWIWRPVGISPAVHWLETSPEEALPRLEPLDVRLVPGIRLVVCEGSGRADIVVQCHHACCDGLGALYFIEDLLIAYAQARGVVSSSALRVLRPERLRSRGRFGLTARNLPKTLSNLMTGLGGVRRFLMRTPKPLVPHRPCADESSVASDYPASLTTELDETECARLRTAARQWGVSTNDLLARDFFLALNEWRRRRVPDRDGGWLRLTVPVNLRTQNDQDLPAANVVTMVFLDRLPADMEHPHRLLDSIHEQIQRIKNRRLGLLFVLSLGVCRWLPGGLRRGTRASRCMATTVLTNLGVVLDRGPLPHRDGHVAIDDLVLERVDAMAPLRPLTSAAAGVCTYAGRLCITLHYDSRVLDQSDATELLDGFAARIRRSAASRQNLSQK